MPSCCHWLSSPRVAPPELFSLRAALSLALLFVIQLPDTSFLSLFWTVVKVNVSQQTREGQLIAGTQQLTLEWRRVEISIMASGSWDTTLGKERGVEFYLSTAVRAALPEQSDTQSCKADTALQDQTHFPTAFTLMFHKTTGRNFIVVQQLISSVTK